MSGVLIQMSVPRRCLRLLLPPLAGLLGLGCFAPVHREDLVGTFRLRGSHARDELSVSDDGRYTHIYAPPGGAALTDSGRWTIDTVEGVELIVFDNFVLRFRNETFPDLVQPPGYWPVRAERGITGRVRLNADRDLGWFYEK